MTGLHTVRDLFCNVCHQTLGWKYVRGCPLGVRLLPRMHEMVAHSLCL